MDGHETNMLPQGLFQLLAEKSSWSRKLIDANRPDPAQTALRFCSAFWDAIIIKTKQGDREAAQRMVCMYVYCSMRKGGIRSYMGETTQYISIYLFIYLFEIRTLSKSSGNKGLCVCLFFIELPWDRILAYRKREKQSLFSVLTCHVFAKTNLGGGSDFLLYIQKIGQPCWSLISMQHIIHSLSRESYQAFPSNDDRHRPRRTTLEKMTRWLGTRDTTPHIRYIARALFL